ncbi:hypothetical protein T02_12434 [Trichinella nativa]|uniref:Secreted protein n=1 Tax=Trichinella nativa TaxID=6335 RepID=A0A0V1LJQ1_9BILA|nr:hypothetical protein T02_12434 [Trichinella nativa]
MRAFIFHRRACCVIIIHLTVVWSVSGRGQRSAIGLCPLFIGTEIVEENNFSSIPLQTMMTSVKFGGIDTFNLPAVRCVYFGLRWGRSFVWQILVFSIIFYCGGDRSTAAAAAAAATAAVHVVVK